MEPGYYRMSFYFTLKASLPLVFCLLVTSFLHLNLSGNILIYLSFLKDSFSEHRMSGMQPPSVSNVSMSSIASWPLWFLMRIPLLILLRIIVRDWLLLFCCFQDPLFIFVF